MKHLRALRRHHKTRLKRKRKYHYISYFDEVIDLDIVNNNLKFVDTPTRCSCWMCGNPRKYWNEETRQEISSRAIFYEQARSF